MNVPSTRSSLIAVCLLAGTASAQQNCLTTTFQGGTQVGGNGWVNCFDITVAPSSGGITLESISVNRSSGQVWANIEVYMVLNDTYKNHSTGGVGAWTLMSTGFGFGAPLGKPTNINIADFHIPPGTHAIGIRFVDLSPAFTPGNGSNQQYTDGTVTLDLGHAVTGLFSGVLHEPSVWNGTLCYSDGFGLTTYCTAKRNSFGCSPEIADTGTQSVSATSGFTIECTWVRNNKPGLLFYKAGGSQASVAFQCGTLCVGPSGIQRTPARSSGGNPAPADDCSGVYSIDMNAFAAGMGGGNPDPALLTTGILVQCQWWGRDQGFAAPCNTTLSDGGEYMTQP